MGGDQPRISRTRLGGLLTLAMMVPTLIPFAVGVLAPTLIAEFDLTRTAYGTIPSAFFLVAAISSPYIGRLADAVGGRVGLVGLFVTSTVAFAGFALSTSLPWLVLAAAVGGVAAAAGNPITNQLLLIHVPQGSRGNLIGVKQSGVWLGGALVGFVLPTFSASFGWRSAFALAGALGLTAAAGVALTLPRSGVKDRTGRREAQSTPMPPDVRWLVAYAVAMGAGGSAVTTYIALFAHERLAMSESLAGATLAVVGVTAVIARVVWANLAEDAADAVKLLSTLAIGALCMTALLTASEALQPVAVWIAVAGLGATALAWNAAGMMLVVDMSDVTIAGQASGIVLRGFYVGLLVAPVSFGAVVDTTGSYVAGWGLTATLFVAALAVTVLWQRMTESDRPPEPRPRSCSG